MTPNDYRYQVTPQYLQDEINRLKKFRTSLANRPGWFFTYPASYNVMFGLFEITGSVIIALEQTLNGYFRDKNMLMLVQERFEKIMTSKDFEECEVLSKNDFDTRIITRSTYDYIRLIRQDLRMLTGRKLKL